MSDYYDMDGEPIDLEVWGALFESADRHVGKTVHGEVMVSTVWIGIDHSWGDGPPLIFETMIFGGDHDQEQWRYSTLEQAKTGHEVACNRAFGKEIG